MLNRNVFKIFAIVFAVVCLYQLSFTWVADGVENDANEYARAHIDNNLQEIISENFSQDSLVDSLQLGITLASIEENKKKFYLDSINSEKVYDILLTSYTYAECKQREINLGLDLTGGMNVTLDVMVVDVVKALSNNSNDSIFNVAISNALKAQENSQDNFVTLFQLEYEKLAPAPNIGLSAIFATPDLRDKIQFSSIFNKSIH